MSDSNYRNVSLDNPEDIYRVAANISTFGGPEDVASGQDNGEFAFGGGSVTPEGGESEENYAAIDPAWYKHGVKPGSTIYVSNPKTGDSVPVILRDKGPARWTGRGIDVAPHVLKQLGMNTDDEAILDFKTALMPQDSEDLNTAEGASSYVAREGGRPERLVAGSASGGATSSGGSQQPAHVGVTKLPDGGYDLGNGVVGYPNGIFQRRTGNSVTEYIPDDSQMGGYKTHTFTVKSGDKSPNETMVHEGAKKGVVPEDYDMTTPEGRKQYRDELKLTLGAGVADDIAEAIMSGTQPPDTKGLYRTGPQVRAKLAQQGYDLKNANLDWQAAQKFTLAVNSPPLVRLRASANTAYHSLDLIDQYSNEWKAGRFPAFNKAMLAAAQQGTMGPEAQRIAFQLNEQITTLQFELGNVVMGGNSPTDQSLQQMQKALSADWPQDVMASMTDQARKNLAIRINSFKQISPAGMSEEAQKEARWTQEHPTAAPSATPAPAASPSASPTKQKSVGDTVKLNGQLVVIDSIDPATGRFTYHIP